MEPKGKPGSFAPYIRSGRRNVAREPAGESSEPRPAGAAVSRPIDLLRLIAQGPEPMNLDRLGELSRLPANIFREWLRELQASGFIMIEGPQLSETVSLTDVGKRVVSVG
jgi:hypothetical protein